MNDLRKASEMALNYFESAYELDSHEIEIREALRQALAQHVDAVNMSQECVDETAKREHEPVGWLNANEGVDAYAFTWRKKETHDIPLYTAPPKREWVGLTDEEICKCAGIDGGDTWIFETAYDIQAKLKEKNT